MRADQTRVETTIENGDLVMRTIIGGTSRVVGRWRYSAGRMRSVARPSRLRRALAWMFADPMAW